MSRPLSDPTVRRRLGALGNVIPATPIVLVTELGLMDRVLWTRLLTVLKLTSALWVHPFNSVLKCGTSYGMEVHRCERVSLRSVRQSTILPMLTLKDPVHLMIPRMTRFLVGPPSNETSRLKSLCILRDKLLVVCFSRTVNDAPLMKCTSPVGLPTLLGTGTRIGLVKTLETLARNLELLKCRDKTEVRVLSTDLVTGDVNRV